MKISTDIPVAPVFSFYQQGNCGINLTSFLQLCTAFFMFDATIMGNNAVPCTVGVGINYPFQAAIGLNFSTTKSLGILFFRCVIETIVIVAE